MMTTSEHTILDSIDRDREKNIDFLRQLVAFDSQVIEHGLDGKEGKLQDYLAEWFRARDYYVDVFEPDNERIAKYAGYSKGHTYKNRPCVVAVLKGNGNGNSMLLNGHVDTMDPQDTAAWHCDPWQGRISEGRIYGLGATDMKAGVAAMIMAAECVRNTGLELAGDVILEMVCDEEGGGNGTLACVDRGYTADAAIIPEPSSLQIQPMGRGVFLLQIRVTGKSIHASEKWRGVNAIEKMIKVIESLHELERMWMGTRRNRVGLERTITYGRIDGGTTANTLAQQCILKCDVKYSPTETDLDGKEEQIRSETVQQEIKDWILTICQGDSWLRDHPPELMVYQDVSPFYTDISHPFVRTLHEKASSVLADACVSGSRCGSDARHLANLQGIPTVVFGPGDLWMAHSIDEYVRIDAYQKAIQVLALSLLAWSGEALQ
jgi:acetylornithine deacetylase